MHQQPVDGRGSCLDSCRALASYAEVHFVDCWLDDRGPGNDFVGVFSKTAYPRASREKLRRVDLQFGMNRYKRDRSPAPIFTEASGDDIEIGCGDRTRSEVLREIHTALQPRLYLEIGVRDGESLALASCPSIAIDPQPGELHPGVDGAQIYQQTSDYFFEFCVEGAIAGRPIDLAFIDGMHRFEFVLRDLMNVERHMHKSSVLVIDDIFPNHPQQASPHRESKLWTGDVWKIYHCLVERRPDLTLFPVNTFPTGLLIVANLDAHNHLLREQYNFLVSGYGQASIQGFQELILERQGARSGHDQQIIDFLRQVRQMREVAGRA